MVKARDYLPLWHLQQGYCWPKYLWQSEPIAETLFKADAGIHPIAAAQGQLHTYITKVKQEMLARRAEGVHEETSSFIISCLPDNKTPRRDEIMKVNTCDVWIFCKARETWASCCFFALNPIVPAL